MLIEIFLSIYIIKKKINDNYFHIFRKKSEIDIVKMTIQVIIEDSQTIETNNLDRNSNSILKEENIRRSFQTYYYNSQLSLQTFNEQNQLVSKFLNWLKMNFFKLIDFK